MHIRKQHQGAALQCRAFSTWVTPPVNGSKPKLWGYHKAHNAKPSLCVTRDGEGVVTRIVKSSSKAIPLHIGRERTKWRKCK